MKKFNLFGLLFFILMILFSQTAIKAQDDLPPPDEQNQSFKKPRRPNLLEELNLTQDQRRQIRQLNIERKPKMRAAQERLREANLKLDQSIYADNVNDAEIQANLKEVQSAQAELFKIRAMSELAVRQILTPTQIVKFRELRQSFMENRQNRFDRQPDRPTDEAPPEDNQRSRRRRPKN